MAFQGGTNLYVNVKSQTTPGSLASSGAGATRMRINKGSPGLNLSKATINPGENRGDGLTTLGVHGSHVVQGSYNADLSVGSFDTILEAMLRGTWSASAAISNADSLGDLTAVGSTGVVTFATGGLTALAKSYDGDILTCTAGLAAGDLNKRLRLKSQNNTTWTLERVDGVALSDVSSPAATYSFTRHKRLIQGVTRRRFTVEEYEIDIDSSELYDYCCFGRMDLGLTPDNMGVLTFGAVGRTADTEESGTAPYFTGETPASTLGLSATQAKIKLGANTLIDITDLQLGLDLRAAGQPVVGSNYTPEIFDNDAQMTARITGLRQDFTRFASFLAEDIFELYLYFGENETAPEDFIQFYLPRCKLANASKSALGQDGPRTQSFDLMIGADDAGGASLKTMLQISTSAA